MNARRVKRGLARRLLVVASLASCACASTNGRVAPGETVSKENIMMSIEKNKDTLVRLYERGFGAGDMHAVDALVTPERPDHEPSLPPELTRDREGLKRAIGFLRAAFPDLRMTSKFMVGEGDKVVSVTTIEGTHKGDFLGAPGTGKHFSVDVADICRFAPDGRIAEHWGFLNMPAIMQQLGVTPRPPAP